MNYVYSGLCEIYGHSDIELLSELQTGEIGLEIMRMMSVNFVLFIFISL